MSCENIYPLVLGINLSSDLFDVFWVIVCGVRGLAVRPADHVRVPTMQLASPDAVPSLTLPVFLAAPGQRQDFFLPGCRDVRAESFD